MLDAQALNTGILVIGSAIGGLFVASIIIGVAVGLGIRISKIIIDSTD